MSNETITLATTFDPLKMTYPAEVSIKLDGDAARFIKQAGKWLVVSRQDKEIKSVSHILNVLDRHGSQIEDGTSIVGELTVVGVNTFKEGSGIVRRHTTDTRIVLNIYDVYSPKLMQTSYKHRVTVIKEIVEHFKLKSLVEHNGVTHQCIKRVPVILSNVQSYNAMHRYLEDSINNVGGIIEGLIIRPLTGKYSVIAIARRSKGLTRFKPKPTVDLEIIAFEEATANKEMTFMKEVYQKGEGLSAVGRIVALYKGNEIGVGPGCLTHAERRDIWLRYVANNEQLTNVDKPVKLIAEVEYMKDDSYTALRQPVFKRWRTDKVEASEVA